MIYEKEKSIMPPKPKFSKTELIDAAFNIVRTNGISNLTSRKLGESLGSSSRIVFTAFENMEEVQQEVINLANKLYQEYIQEDIRSEKYPMYKASGMAYIRFAREEKELFKLLFMRDRTNSDFEQETEEVAPLVQIIQKSTGLDESDARLLHMEMWMFVHGVATTIATSYCPNWDMELISKMLTDAYMGIKYCLCQDK